MAVTSMANSSIRDFTKYNRMSSVLGAPPFDIEYLVHGAGAGATNGVSGTNLGCGAGAGTAKAGTLLNAIGAHSLIVGAGGAGSQGTGAAGNSSVFSSIIATGGDSVPSSLRSGGTNADYSGGGNPGGVDSGGGAGAGANGAAGQARRSVEGVRGRAGAIARRWVRAGGACS